MEMLEADALHPVAGTVRDLEEGAEALRALADRRALGKVVLRVR
jgi:NADPH:quinone reductase-like Zn-dependent oxidoreductase